MTGTTATLAAAVLLAAAPVTDDDARAEVARLAPQVAAVRKLPFHAAVPVRAASREAMRADVTAALSANVASSNIAVEEHILKRLGLIPTAADYTRLLADAASSSPVPYYDPGTKRLLVPNSEPLDAQRLLLAHEIAHALADRRFGLDRFVRLDRGGRPLEGDAQRARLAVIEGDATVTALELHDRRGSLQGSYGAAALADRLRAAVPSRGAPVWLSELARFSHVDGFSFIARIRAQRPWSAVDAVWLDPPASSEQVLHPEKYEACEEPVHVDEALLPAALAGFDRRSASSVLGELPIRAWLSLSLPEAIAARAAAGWGGDRAAIYTADPGARADAAARADAGMASQPAEPLLAWLTVWDDAGEADDFARAAREVPGEVAVSRRGEAVALFFGPPALAPAALDGMLDAWRAATAPTKRGTVKGSATPDAQRGARPRRAAQPDCPRRDRTTAPR